MATFQIHEDVENMYSKINSKKYLGECEKKNPKKKFGENNTAATQPLNKNGLKESQQTKVTVKNSNVGKEQVKKQKLANVDDIDKVSCLYNK